ncbi:MAG TPA: glycerate kinase [Deltaproteobacteria bacterium]|nr:glycerate kinase [Deltaproteobacteria bacterium]
MNPKQDIRAIFAKAVERVDPRTMITQNMALEENTLLIHCNATTIKEDLTSYDRIFVLGIGKASSKMGRAIEDILGKRITAGKAVTKYGHSEKLDIITVTEAGHPIPDENSVRGAGELYELAHTADEHTLIINLVSGGGSALFCLPAEGVSLQDKQDMTRILLECGANIKEINCIRKHISLVKGGHFARVSYPARMINIILSDVIGDRLDTIASGITVADDTTFAQAQGIIDKYHIHDRVPASISALIRAGCAGKVPDTPKLGDRAFANISNILLGNNAAACRAARDYGASLGYNACFLTSSLSGEASQIARVFTAMAKDIDQSVSDLKRPALIVAGGETTVTIRGSGKGGRNQEMALAFLIELMEDYNDFTGIHFLSGGTDGNDGPTDAAGAVVSLDTIKCIAETGIRPSVYLDNNDSYHFFEKTGGLVITGPTNTNVCDIQLLIVE